MSFRHQHLRVQAKRVQINHQRTTSLCRCAIHPGFCRKFSFWIWFFQKDGNNEKVFLGKGNRWEIVGGRDLDGPVTYKIIFEFENNASEFCKTEDFVDFTVNRHSNFNINFEKGVDNCNSKDGVLVIETVTKLDILRVRREGIVIAAYRNLIEGEVIKIPNLSPGLYVASGALNGCSSSRGTVLPLINPPSGLQYTVQEIIGETCGFSGKTDGQIKIKWLEANFSGSYTLLTATGGIVKRGNLIDVRELTILAAAGNYFLEISNTYGCLNPRVQRITIGSKRQVAFNVPDRFTVCEYYDFKPLTDQNLKFTLTYPDGSKVNRNKGEAFRIDQSGEYFLMGLESDSQNGFCPRETSVFVNVNKQVQFEPELISRDCSGNKQYKASLFGEDPNKFNIKWTNGKNQVVGTDGFLFPISSGEFKLDVQPKNSETCPATAKVFIIENNVLSVEGNLKASVLCPGSSSLIELSTDLAEVKKIFWIFIDPTGNSSVLDEYRDMTEFTVQNPGTYEAVVFNEMNCEIGRNLLTVVETTAMAAFQIP